MNYIKLYYKSRKKIILRIITIIFLVSIGVNLTSFIYFLQDPRLMSEMFSEEFDLERGVNEQDIFFEGISNNISNILKYNQMLQNIETVLDYNEYSEVFTQNYILGFIEGIEQDSRKGVALVLSSFFQEILNLLDIDHLEDSQGILIYEEELPFENQTQNFVINSDLCMVEIIANISFDIINTNFPYIFYLLEKTSYGNQIILPISFFNEIQDKDCFIIGSTNLHKDLVTELMWSLSGKEIFDDLIALLASELFKEEIHLEGGIRGSITSNINQSQQIVLIIDTVLKYISIIILIISIITMFFVSYNLMKQNKEIEVEYFLISESRIRNLLWFLEPILNTLVGFISGLIMGLLIFKILSLSYIYEMNLNQQIFHAILYNYVIIQMIIYGFYLFNRNQLISKIENKKSVFRKILIFILFASVIIIIIKQNYYANLLTYSIFAFAFLFYYVFIKCVNLIKYIIVRTSKKRNFLEKLSTPFLMISAFKKSIKRKTFILTIITFIFFSLVIGGEQANTVILENQLWSLGGEIRGTISDYTEQNISEVLQNISAVEKFIPIMKVTDTSLGTENSVITNKFNLISLDWEAAINYYGSKSIKSWLNTKSIPESLNNSVILSQDYKKLGFNIDTQFRIFFENQTDEKLYSYDFNVANHFLTWPSITPNTYVEDKDSLLLWILIPTKKCVEILNVSQTTYSTTYNIRTEIDNINDVIIKLETENVFNSLEYINYDSIEIYQNYILSPIIIGLVSLIPIWTTVFIVTNETVLEEKRIMAFIALTQNPNKSHIKFRFIETIFYIVFSILILLFLNLIVLFVTSLFLKYSTMELNYISLFRVLYWYPAFGFLLSISDYLRLRKVNPAITLRHLE